MAKRILVVDDEAHILQVLSIKLRNAGYEAITAVDGEEAFEIACRDHPDLVITDFQMPYMTGLELCRALADHDATSRIPVVMLTARGYALDDDDLVIGNIKDVLSKPFSPRAIVQQVEAILGGDATGSENVGSEAA
jgi:DNA-binding response OmpR family regulator